MKLFCAVVLLCVAVLARCHESASVQSEQPPYKVLKSDSYEERLYYEGVSLTRRKLCSVAVLIQQQHLSAASSPKIHRMPSRCSPMCSRCSWGWCTWGTLLLRAHSRKTPGHAGPLGQHVLGFSKFFVNHLRPACL